LLVAAAVAALAPLSAAAQQGNPGEPYDGDLPFNCQLQDVGTGTDFPHPESDPFCVEFDKTEQNVTDLGNEIHPQAIAGVDGEPGAVEADALLLGHNPKIGFDVLEPPFLAELESRSLPHGGDFLTLDYDHRQAVCLEGLACANTTRLIWEAGAAIPFTAFCAAATQVNATAATASGFRVMDFPGVAPHGYQHFSFRRKLNKGRTRKGYLA